MRKLIMIIAGWAACLFPATQAATETSRDDARESHLFFGIQGGGQTTFTNYDNTQLIMPYTAVYFGGYYNPVVGARLHASGWRSKGNLNATNYYYNYYTANADLLMNLSNLLWSKNSHTFNLVLLGGIGLNYARHNNDMNNILTQNPALVAQNPTAWKGSQLGHNFRLGLQLDVNVCKHIGVNLEVTANNLSDKFNSKFNNDDDWMLTAAVGVSYKFAFKGKKPVVAPVVVPTPAPAPKSAPAPKPAPKPAPAPAPAPKPAAKPAPAPAPVVKNLKEDIFYEIRSSQIASTEQAKIDRIVAFMKENPSAKIEITGYADVKTGNPTINMKYSQKRADDLKALLVKKYGLDGNKISTAAKGDTVQPFAENVKNRVSIVVGTTAQ